MSIPAGKGIYIWHLAELFNGNMRSLVDFLRLANFNHVSVKAQEGRWSYTHYSPFQHPNQQDLLAELAPMLKAEGIELWLWGYLYGTWYTGNTPTAEASKTIELVQKYGAKGFHIDAEAQYKGQYNNASIYAGKVASAGIAMGLSSYRYPSYHPDFPYKQFGQYCTHHYPQVYWQSAHNPADQLRKSVAELQAKVALPVVPVGAAYSEYGWTPTAADQKEFIAAVQELSLPGISWWSMEHALDLPNVWKELESLHWDGTAPTLPLPLTIEERVARLEGFH